MSDRGAKLMWIKSLLEQARSQLENLVEDVPSMTDPVFEEMCQACDTTLLACNAVDGLLSKATPVDSSLLN